MIYFIFLFFIFTRFIPYFFSSVPTGYDAGIYLNIFKLSSFVPDWLAGSYYTALFNILAPFVKLFSDPSILLIPLQLCSALFLFWCLNWAIKTVMNKEQRLFTLFLFSVSAIQFRMYWFYYVKNMFALGFVLLFLGAIARKKYFAAALFCILVGLIHLPTFFILAAICGVEFLLHKNKLIIAGMFAVSLAITLLYNIPVFSITILPFFKPFVELNRIAQPFGKGDWGGTFYDLWPSIVLMGVYIWLAAISVLRLPRRFAPRNDINRHQPLTTNHFFTTPFFSALIATSVIVLGQFFFFRRFIPAWDLFVIIAAGYSAKQILSMKYFYAVLTALFILVFIYKTGMPLKTPADIAELRASKISNKAYIFSTSKEDTAWIMGYTDAQVIAWNFGGYSQLLTDAEWNAFYSAKTEGEYGTILNKLPNNIYVYISDKEKSLYAGLIQMKNLHKLSRQVYQYIR